MIRQRIHVYKAMLSMHRLPITTPKYPYVKCHGIKSQSISFCVWHSLAWYENMVGVTLYALAAALAMRF